MTYSPIAWYFGDIVVGWCRTRMSPSNSQQHSGFIAGCTSTMPFLIWLRRTYIDREEYITTLMVAVFVECTQALNKYYSLAASAATRTFLRAKDAVCPPRTSFTGSLLRWIPLITTGTNSPSRVGPNSRVSLMCMIP